MTVADIQLVAKKVLVGIIITIIPLAIIYGGILLTQKVLGNNVTHTSTNQ